MTKTAEEFVEDFLEHAYDPVKAHEYYLRTRVLKGRADAKVLDSPPSRGTTITTVNGVKKINGLPWPRKDEKVYEDDPRWPTTSPTGSKIVGFKNGIIFFADGTTFSFAEGFSKPKRSDQNSRLQNAQKKLNKLRERASKMSGPAKQELLRKVNEAEAKLNGLQPKSNTPIKRAVKSDRRIPGNISTDTSDTREMKTLTKALEAAKGDRKKQEKILEAWSKSRRSR